MPEFLRQLMQMMGQQGGQQGGQQSAQFANTTGQPGTNVGDPGFGNTPFGQQSQFGQGGGFFNTTGQPGTNVGDPGFPFPGAPQPGTDPRTRFLSRRMGQRGGGGLTRAPQNRAIRLCGPSAQRQGQQRLAEDQQRQERLANGTATPEDFEYMRRQRNVQNMRVN